MKGILFMKKSVLGLVLAAAGTSAVLAAPPAYDRTLHIPFEKNNGAINAWPRNFAPAATLIKGDAAVGEGAWKIAPKDKGGAFYFTFPSHLYSGGYRSPAPGVLNLSFYYKSEDPAKAPALSCSVNFNKKGGGHGSNGNSRVTIPRPQKEYKRFFANVALPAGTVDSQLVFGFGVAQGSVQIDDLRVSYSGDTKQLPVSQYNGKLALPLNNRFWNPNYRLFGFYNNGRPSRIDTQLQVTADPQGLYVAFINNDNPNELKAKYTKDEDILWMDDCNEIFLFDEARQTGWQLVSNSTGARTDYQMYQRVPGDPWRVKPEWNGKWQVLVQKNKDNWENRFFIPWSTLGLTYKEGIKLKFNFTRQAKTLGENSSYNCGVFSFNDITGFGSLNIENGVMTIQRTRSNKKIEYTVKRTTKPESVLKPAARNAIRSNLWCTVYNYKAYPKAIKDQYDVETLKKFQVEMIRAMGESGSGGPQHPWAINAVQGGLPALEAYQAKYGRGMLFAMLNSDIGRAARRNGATLLNPDNDHSVDATDPAYLKASINWLEASSKKPDFPRIAKNTYVMRGVDEPTNELFIAYNVKRNAANAAKLAEVDKVIKEKYGFGKYGLPAFDGSANDEESLKRIALIRYWHDEYRKNMEEWTKVIRRLFPNSIWHVTNSNTVCGQSMLDVAMFDGLGDEISCDPYPTSTKALLGMERAIYHTGYSTKIVHDLVPNTTTQSILQGFIYHGGQPSINDMREWASQAIKTGAKSIEWYIDRSLFTMFDEYVGLLNIMHLINNMEYDVVINEKPASAIWYSNYDVWAFHDMATHAAYSIYSILGEHLKSDFRFINENLLKLNKARLNELKVIYVPRMAFIDQTTAATLTDWVKNGGRLVIFDPEFMRKNIDGTSAAAARKALTGVDWPLNKRKVPQGKITWNKLALDTTEQRNVANQSAEFPILAYDMPVPAGAKVVATYSDGKPAAIERKVGKGSVVYFAVQPFGGSTLAVEPGKWKNFFAAEAQKAGEPTGIARWDFLLPEIGKTVKLDPIK